MIDHKKIEDAIDSYFKNTPTAKIIENLDRLSADRDKDLERENINHKATNNKDSIIGNLVRFEEVSPANQDAAFLAVSIEQLVAHLGLPLYEGYDDLDEMRFTFLTLPSGETVTIGEYLNCPQPGTSIYVDVAMQNVPQIVFDSCLQLQVAREEVIWFHPDWQEEIDRLYVDHGAIEKRPELSQVEELTQSKQYEPIDCFNHALRIYTREYVPATYWAMLQHNLGLAYFNRNKGDRRENLERSIECFRRSLEVFTKEKFPEKWGINQEDLRRVEQSVEELLLLQKQVLAKDILERKTLYPSLQGSDSRGTISIGANLNNSNSDLFATIKNTRRTIGDANIIVEERVSSENLVETLRHFIKEENKRLDIVKCIGEINTCIVTDAVAGMIFENQNLVQEGGNCYPDRRMTACLRDTEIILRYVHYSLLAGDSSVLDNRLLSGLRQTYLALGVPLLPAIRSIQIMKIAVITHITNTAKSKLTMTQNDYSSLVEEVASYFDYIIVILS
jgi:phycoerythrin beta chain